MSSRLAALALTLVLAAACAPPPPVVTTPVPPQHPEYVFPAAPAGTPKATVDRLARGWRLLQSREAPAAEREFAALLNSNRDFAPARAGAGYALLAQQRPEQALPHFAAASPAGRPFAPALFGQGLALLDLGREEDALVSLEGALAVDATIPLLAERVATLRVRVVQDRISRAQRAAAEGRLDDARTAYRTAIESSPDAAFLYRDLAAVERRAGRPETALELSRAALVYDPDDVRSHVMIGDVLAEREEWAEALASYSRAAAIEPSAAIEAATTRARERLRDLSMPAPYRAIGSQPQATRADLAALIGVRLTTPLERAPERQVVVTDVRGHWAEPWIRNVARAGAMEIYPNYTFQPDAPLRRLGLADAVSRALAVLLPPETVAVWDDTPVTMADLPPQHLAFPAVRRAVAAGVMRLDGGAFNLLGPVTGAEVVEVVGRLAAVAGGGR